MQSKPMRVLLVLLIMLMTPLSLFAAVLEKQQVDAYLDTLDEVKQLGERMKSSGLGAFLEREIMPRAGEAFDPHQRAVMALKREHADQHQALMRIVQRRGFISPESWALVGDRVVLAYGAIKVESESPAILQLARQMQGADPQFMQLLPPEQRFQVEQAMLIAKVLSRVPEADKQQVRPHIARLDRVFSQ